MDITAQDIFAIINKVRENPSLVLNEIKDQLKRYTLCACSVFSLILFTEPNAISKSVLFRVRLDGKILFWLYNVKSQKGICNGILC